MSDYAFDVPGVISGLKNSILDRIYLYKRSYSEEELNEAVEMLLTQPNVVTYIYFRDQSELTNKIGIKLAQYLVVSTRIRYLDLSYNKLEPETIYAIAWALRINTSLRCLYLNAVGVINLTRVESAFVDALILNPNRPVNSCWMLLTAWDSYSRLKKKAERLGHPNMRSLLTIKLFLK